MIEFRQVTKRYDSDHTALRQVNFGLERGELAFLTGHSGAGKSTLLKLIMVMERPSAGEVIVGGQVLNTLPRRQVPYIRRHIGVVFQNHQLLFDRTVFDNVAFGLKQRLVSASRYGIGSRPRRPGFSIRTDLFLTNPPTGAALEDRSRAFHEKGAFEARDPIDRRQSGFHAFGGDAERNAGHVRAPSSCHG